MVSLIVVNIVTLLFIAINPMAPARDSPPHRSRPRSRSRSPRRDRHDRDGERARRGYRGEEGYDSKDRERERAADRERYEDGVVGIVHSLLTQVDRPKSPPKPNFANTGLLAQEANTVKGVTLKYHEPPEARKPVENWRLYVFKGDEQVGGCCADAADADLVHIHRQSCFLVGRDTVVTDVPVQHPSISKQHAVIQFRRITTRTEHGETKSQVKCAGRVHADARPFIIDLDSTNGTYVNGDEVPKSRYYELRASDGGG